MSHIIEVRDLVKEYSGTKVVDGVSFDVERGSLFAFLGPNGAGKSTTISMLTTLLRPTAGTVSYIHSDGGTMDVVRNRKDVKDRLGVVFQDSLLDRELSVRTNLLARARFYGSGRSNLERLQEVLQLKEILDRTYGTLSGGQRRRVDIARALLGDPEVLFLDEPTTGLDPQSRNLVWSTLRKLRGELGITVFLTTHYMEEADPADQVVLIDHGHIIAQGTPSALRRDYSRHVLSFPRGEEIVKALSAAGLRATERAERVQALVENPRDAVDFIAAHRGIIEDFEFVQGDMDDVFLALTGKELRES